MASGKNIILVIFDTLRKDCVGVYGSPPWGKVRTPHLDALASESLVFTRAYPETLPTLPVRRAVYTGQNVYPFHNGDFRLKGDPVTGIPGWGPIPEEQDTLSELLRDRGGYRTGLISDVYHMFKPSKNFWRGFDQWTFLRGQERDPQRSGTGTSTEDIDRWIPRELFDEGRVNRIGQFLKNMHGRWHEEDYFNARVMIEAARWLEENRDADRFFLCVESFDPHEPWFVPEHYRRMYDDSDGREQVMSPYNDVTSWPPDVLHRTRANYSGLVTMCDRWFGHLYEKMRTLGLLDNTLLIVTADHGHSLGDEGFLGKRGYPSEPAVFDLPLLVRHPEGAGAGRTIDMLVNHTDIPAVILEFAGVEPTRPLDGQSFMEPAIEGGKGIRDHVTVGYGPAVTVIDDRWWLNIKIDGTGAFLYDLGASAPREKNVADDNRDVVQRLFRTAVEDAGGAFPEYLMELARALEDAPGCSKLAARPA